MPLTLATFGAIDWTVLVLYLLGMVAIGAFVARKQHDTDDYFLAGRRMPAWAVALSMLATALSAATFIGAPQISFGGDLTYLSLNLGGMLAAIFVAFVLIPPIYRAGTLTIYGYLGRRFGPGAAVAASIAFLIGRLLASGARLFIAGIAFTLILFGVDSAETWHLVVAIIIFGSVGTLYTALGGIRAVIWTDVVQIIVVIGAAVLSIFLLLGRIDMDLGQIIDTLQNAGPRNKLALVNTDLNFAEAFTLWAAVAVVFAESGSYGCDHDLAQRLLTTRSAWRASWSLVAAKIASIPVVMLFLVIGLLLSIFYTMPEVVTGRPPEELLGTARVYPQFLVNHMPAGLAGLAMAGLFAAAMSSLDSAINAMAGTIMADLVFPRRQLRRERRHAAADAPTASPPHSTENAHDLAASRLTVTVVGILLTVFAILAAYMQKAGGQTLINFALGVMSFAYAGLLGVFLAATLTGRGNPATVIAALITGAVIVLTCQPYILGPATERILGHPFTLAWPWWMVIATPVSFAVCVMGASHQPPATEPPGAI